MSSFISPGRLLRTGLAIGLATALWLGASLVNLSSTDRNATSWVSPAAAESGKGKGADRGQHGDPGSGKGKQGRERDRDPGDDGGPQASGDSDAGESRSKAGPQGPDGADDGPGKGRSDESRSDGKDNDGKDSDGNTTGGSDGGGSESGGSEGGADTAGSADADSSGRGGAGSEGDVGGGLAGGDGPGQAGEGDEGPGAAGPGEAAGSGSAAAESPGEAGSGEAAASDSAAAESPGEAGPGEAAASDSAAGEDPSEAGPNEAAASDSAAAESPSETSLSDAPGIDVEPAAGPASVVGSGVVAGEPEVRAAAALAPPDPSPATPRELDNDRGRDRAVAREVVVIDRDPTFISEAQDLGFRVIDEHVLPGLGLTVTRLAAPARLTTIAARNLLRARFPEVLADSNTLYRQQGSRSLPATNYAERLIGWARPPAACGSELAIGLIDTGVAVDHPAFAGGVIASRSFLSPGVTPAPLDHGTAVAGILVGSGGDGAPPGLLPGATLRVAETFLLDSQGEPAASVVAVATALDWLIQQHTPVINLSIAGDDNLLLATAVERAAERGVVLVAAAGNGGPAGPAAYPAAYPGVLAVAAVDRDLAPYANGSRGGYIDLAAPGVDIATVGPKGLSLVSGSSFAAPYVAAAAAVRIGSGPPVDTQALYREMARNVLDLGLPGRDPVFGWGLLQAPSQGCATGQPSPA